MIRYLVILAVCGSIVFSAKSTKCPPNEEFQECGTACEPKCNEPKKMFCTFECINDVCQCKQGFKRGPNGCVRPSKDCT
ncbi:unnamed protein product [Cylicocyclus nassatus]|uniref:TIL domain-containing protein n=1 Tax=Cylicocyclus nassatus TaxID=53992 RepID=A0AA36HEM3_CYLNA|nr:unnamed protein product [Cylicocyclus nassatus]